MSASRLIKIKPDSEYNKIMLDENEKYYSAKGVDFTSTYKGVNESLEWREPTTPRMVFFEIFEKIAIDSDWVFFDCGSGLGHAMYLASYFFKKIYGIEFLKEIMEISEHNLKVLMPLTVNYKIFYGDMLKLDIRLLNEINVFYISSPFDEKAMFAEFIKMIKNSLLEKDREVWLIYFYPYFEDVMRYFIDLLPLEISYQSIGKVNYYHHKMFRDSRLSL
ncbi:class I SAM-dependent methyltransferase [Breznakiellaceae bacterium SP9]